MLIYNTLSGLFDARLVFVEESGRQFFTLLNEPLESPFNQMIKRVFDLFLSVPALIVLFPPLIILVKFFQFLQSPVLYFSSKRVGIAGKRFVIWKFRSMTHDADGSRDESIQAFEGSKDIWLRQNYEEV